MSIQFEPKDVLSKSKVQYDRLAYRLVELRCSSIQDGSVHAQINAVESALIRLDWDWAAQKEP
jgi:hypothetical protein